jgi:hypothetical protein
VPVPEKQGLLAQRGWSIGPVAASSHYLLWTAASSDEADDALLFRRDLRTRKTVVMSHLVFQAFGASTASGSVIYATRSGTGAQLEAMPVAGGRPRVLSRSLAAPFDARGDMVAWAEADSSNNRVVVRNMRTGREFVAYEGARCRQARCRRIDRVTVADDGVVFDLGSVGQGYPSLIARRRWDAAQPSFARVPRDPQPDLARSFAGALYYQLGRGWMQWDFDQPQPTRTWPHGLRPWLLSREHDHKLVLGGATCATTLAVRTGSRTVAVAAPRSTPVSPTGFGKLCRQLTGFAWSGNRLLLAWTLTPRISIEGHKEVGVSGIITAVNAG